MHAGRGAVPGAGDLPVRAAGLCQGCVWAPRAAWEGDRACSGAGPPAIRTPPGEAAALESKVPLPPESHLGQDVEFEVPPRSAEQECCGRT